MLQEDHLFSDDFENIIDDQGLPTTNIAIYPTGDINDELKAFLKEEENAEANSRSSSSAVPDRDEMDIMASRMSHSNPNEQKSELLRFIAQKESHIQKLHEELNAQEEELQLLKDRLNEIVIEERGPAAISDHARRRAFSLPPISTAHSIVTTRPLSPTILDTEEALLNAGKAVYQNLNRGIFSLLQNTQKFLESDTFQQTRSKAFQMGQEAIRSTREITTEVTSAIAESEAFQTGRQITREVLDNVVQVTNEVLTGDFGGVPENDVILPPPGSLGSEEEFYVGHAGNEEDEMEVQGTLRED